MKGIDPKWAMYLGLLVTIEQAIGHGTVSLTNLVPADWAPYITSWCNFLAFAGTSIMTYQAAVSAPTAGPAANTAIAPVAKPIVIMALLLGGLFAFAGDASAQGIKLKPPQVTGDFAADAKANLGIGQPTAAPALTGNVEKDVQALWKKIAGLTKADLTYAMAKAKAAGTNGASIRLQCLQAISDANDQANGAGLKNPDGTDMVRPDPALVTAIEDAAELIDNLSPQGKLFTSCAGAAQMFKTNTLAAISAIVTGAAGIAALPAGL